MARPNSRTSREQPEKLTDVIVAETDTKQLIPPNGATYIRWDNSTCPYGADTIYSGVVAVSNHLQGAAVDPLCLPSNPQYLKSHSGYQGLVQAYGAEYEIITGSPIDQAHNCNIPCALCQAYERTNKIMILSHYECPLGWNTEYYGYLMAGHYTHKAVTQFTCMDSLSQMQLTLMESFPTILKHIVITSFLIVVKISLV